MLNPQITGVPLFPGDVTLKESVTQSPVEEPVIKHMKYKNAFYILFFEFRPRNYLEIFHKVLFNWKQIVRNSL